MEIKIANNLEIREVKKLLSDYIQENNSERKIVGERFLSELNNCPSMVVFLALDNRKEIVGVSNCELKEKYGISYHTISFLENRGIGSLLFKKKISYLLEKCGNVVTKPESQAGLRLVQKNNFVRAANLDDLIYWEGDSYILNHLK